MNGSFLPAAGSLSDIASEVQLIRSNAVPIRPHLCDHEIVISLYRRMKAVSNPE